MSGIDRIKEYLDYDPISGWFTRIKSRRGVKLGMRAGTQYRYT